jgi:hypothetical protein
MLARFLPIQERPKPFSGLPDCNPTKPRQSLPGRL